MTKKKNRLFIELKEKQNERTHREAHEVTPAKLPVRGVMRKTVPRQSHLRNRDIGQR